MTRDDRLAVSVTTAEEFERTLAAVVQSAVTGGVDVRGAWEFRTTGSTHDWEVNVTELAKRDGESQDE